MLKNILNWLVGNKTKEVLDQLHTLRPLPMGMAEFDEWSDRIISGAMISCDLDSQKFACASMLKMLGPTEDHKEDIYFIKSIRRSVIQQIADAKIVELRDKAKARLAAQQAAEPPPPVAVKPDLHVVTT